MSDQRKIGNWLGIGSVKLEDDEVGLVGKMVLGAKGKVRRVHSSSGSVGELRSGVGEDVVPPREELWRVAFVRDGVVASSVTGRD
jgi:hypothetical protein